MVSLTNQARLLAAQAFNKQVLEEKARAKQAELEAERQKELARSTRRLQEAKARARNPVEASRIQNSINQVLKSDAEKKRRKKVEQEFQRKSGKVFQRVAKGSNIGVLTGFEAKKDSKGRTVGISKKESATRKNTKKLLLREIQRQQEIASKETDLERFLKNEKRLNSGNITRAELNRQIADRKRRGLSKTPAQKRADARLRDQETLTSLQARNRRKQARGVAGRAIQTPAALLGLLKSEEARAGGLGSSPFTDPLFNFGGRSKKEVIARGGTFGRRVGGESIDSQLAFISNAKKSTTSGRINFAQGLLANLNFEGSSQSSLLNIVGSQTKDKKTGRLSQIQFAPPTFEQTLREGQGFFTTVAKPVTKPKITKAQRARLVNARKAEDFAKANKAREGIQATKARTARKQVENRDDLARISQSLLSSNIARGAEIERTNLLARPRISRGDFGFVENPRIQARDALGRQIAQDQISDFGIDLGGFQRQQRNIRAEPTARQLLSQRDSIDFVAPIGQALTPKQRKAQAVARQKETKAIRAQQGRDFSGLSFGRGDDFTAISAGLVQATGESGRSVVTSAPTPVRTPQAISVGLSETIGIGDRAGVDQVFAPITPREQIQASTRRGQEEGDRRTGDEGRSNEEIFGGIGEGIQSFFAFEGLRGGGDRPASTPIEQSGLPNPLDPSSFSVDFNDPILQGGAQAGGDLLVGALPKSLQGFFGR